MHAILALEKAIGIFALYLQSTGLDACIISIQDWMAMDENLRLKDANAERINVPAIPQYYWRYRMHVSIEDLIENKSFTQNIKDLVQESGR